MKKFQRCTVSVKYDTLLEAGLCAANPEVASEGQL